MTQDKFDYEVMRLWYYEAIAVYRAMLAAKYDDLNKDRLMQEAVMLFNIKRAVTGYDITSGYFTEDQMDNLFDQAELAISKAPNNSLYE